MNLAFVLVFVSAVFVRPAFAADAAAVVEVTGALVESADGSVCFLNLANRDDLVPPELSAASTAVTPPANVPVCATERVTALRHDVRAQSRPAGLGFETVAPAVCGFALLTGIGNAARAISERGEPLATGEPGLYFGAGAGLVAGNLAKLTLRGLMMIPGMGVVGAACAIAGEWATYQVYYLVVPKAK